MVVLTSFRPQQQLGRLIVEGIKLNVVGFGLYNLYVWDYFYPKSEEDKRKESGINKNVGKFPENNPYGPGKRSGIVSSTGNRSGSNSTSTVFSGLKGSFGEDHNNGENDNKISSGEEADDQRKKINRDFSYYKSWLRSRDMTLAGLYYTLEHNCLGCNSDRSV